MDSNTSFHLKIQTEVLACSKIGQFYERHNYSGSHKKLAAHLIIDLKTSKDIPNSGVLGRKYWDFAPGQLRVSCAKLEVPDGPPRSARSALDTTLRWWTAFQAVLPPVIERDFRSLAHMLTIRLEFQALFPHSLRSFRVVALQLEKSLFAYKPIASFQISSSTAAKVGPLAFVVVWVLSLMTI